MNALALSIAAILQRPMGQASGVGKRDLIIRDMVKRDMVSRDVEKRDLTTLGQSLTFIS
jgi:hypothetical protein